MTELSERIAVRVLPYAGGDLDRLMHAVSFYRPVTMRRDAICGLDADVAQPAVVNILATHARVPEPIVREAVTAIVAGADELGRRNSLFAGLGKLFAPLPTQGPSALAFGGVVLHPGALAAYRDVGLLAERAAT
jgi:TRAP-type uncharacterized transport system substrate-binding protein